MALQANDDAGAIPQQVMPAQYDEGGFSNSMINGTADGSSSSQAQSGRQSVQVDSQLRQTMMQSGTIGASGGMSYGSTGEEPRMASQPTDKGRQDSDDARALGGVESQTRQTVLNEMVPSTGDNEPGHGSYAPESSSPPSAQHGYYTPRSVGSVATSRPQWIQGLELPGWVSRLGSLLSVPARPELVPSPLAGSSASTSPLRDRVMMMAHGPRRMAEPRPQSPSPPSSSSIPAEAIQAEVQRQLGELLGRLQTVEQDRDRLRAELSQERARATNVAWSPWINAGGEMGVAAELPVHEEGLRRDPPPLPQGPPVPQHEGSRRPVLQGEAAQSAPPRSTEATTTTSMPTFGSGPQAVGEPEGGERSSLLRSLLGPRVRTPSPVGPPRQGGESSILEALTKGVQQLQELQAQALTKGEAPPTIEVVKPGTVALPLLPDLKKGDAAGSALKFQDWLEISSSILADVSEHSGQWWEQILQMVGTTYGRWLAATPLERLQITPAGETSLCSGRWIRVNARIASMILTSMGDELKADAVAQRITQSVPRMVFRLFTVFQPGGSAERQDLLQRLQSPRDSMKGESVEDALRVLQAWPRWVARCASMKMTPPDPQVLARGLMDLTSAFINSSPDAAFRTSMLRTSLRLDAQPDLEQVTSYQRHLQAELETLVNAGTMATATSTTSPKVRAAEVAPPGKRDKGADLCRHFAKPSGCKRGSRCNYSHSMAGMDKELRWKKCLACGSESHRQKECPVNKPRTANPSTSSPSSASKNEKESSPSRPQPVSVQQLGAPIAAGEGSSGIVPGVPWTLESLIQATQQFVQAQPQPGQEERPSSPEKTGGSVKSLVVKDIRVSAMATTTALLDSGATHSLRAAKSKSEWANAEGVMVTLAGDSQLAMKMNEGGTLLLPPQLAQGQSAAQTIVPLGELVRTLGYSLVWTPTKCILEDGEGNQIPLSTNAGCPQVREAEALAMIARLEDRKLEQLENAAMVTNDRVSMAAMALRRSWFDRLQGYVTGEGSEARQLALRALRDAPFFQDVPGECLGGLVPEDLPGSGWEALKGVSFLSRPQRRRLLGAKKWVVHLFSGDPGHYEIAKLDRGDTVVLQLDIRNSRGQDITNPETWKMLMWGAREGRIDLVLGGPPGRAHGTWTKGGNCTNLRAWTLISRMMWLHSCAVAGRCTRTANPTYNKQVGFVLEHPGIPTNDEGEGTIGGGFWETDFWKRFKEETGQIEVSFDQRAMGANRTNRTTLGTNILYMKGLDGVGLDDNTATTDVCAELSDYSVWSPGLVNALVVGLHLWSMSPRAYSMTPRQWKSHVDSNHLPYRRDCVTCVMAKGTGRRHARVHHPDSFVLTSDLAGPVRPGLDPTSKGTTGKGIKYLLVARYVFPSEYLKAYSGREPPADGGLPNQEEESSSPCSPELEGLFEEAPEGHRDQLPHGDEGAKPSSLAKAPEGPRDQLPHGDEGAKPSSLAKAPEGPRDQPPHGDEGAKPSSLAKAPEGHRDQPPHGDEGEMPNNSHSRVEEVPDHTNVLDDVSDVEYEPSEPENNPDPESPNYICVQDLEPEAEEEKGEDKRRPHPVMNYGDCEPPEQTSLIFAVGLRDNKGATVKSALQDITLYLGSHGLPVYRFHADKGEFFNHSLRDWLRAQGIRGTWGEPGIPQTNGRAEGAVRWVKDRIRTLLLSAKVSTKLWPLAAETAAAEQRSRVLGWSSMLAAPFGAPVYVKKRPFKAQGPRLRADTFEAKWVKGKYMGLSGLLNRGHVIYVEKAEGETESFLHTLHVRANLVDPGEPELELRADPEMKPRYKVIGKKKPDQVEMRELRLQTKEEIEEYAAGLLEEWTMDEAIGFAEEPSGDGEEIRGLSTWRCGGFDAGAKNLPQCHTGFDENLP